MVWLYGLQQEWTHRYLRSSALTNVRKSQQVHSCWLFFGGDIHSVYAQQVQKIAQGTFVLEQKFYESLVSGIYQYYKGYFYQVYEIEQNTENFEYFLAKTIS